MGNARYFGLGFILFFLSLFLYSQIGLTSTAMTMGFIIAVITAGIVIAKYMKRSGKKGSFYFRGDIPPDKAKYIAIKHIESNFHVPLFINDGGDEDLEYTRYSVPVVAERCYPASGEEAWVVKVAVHDERFFRGLHTRILIYIDGGGRVMNDPIMNADMKMDESLWKNPNLYFRDIVPKTAKPRSMKEIMAEKMEQEGNIPEGMGATMFRGEDEGE